LGFGGSAAALLRRGRWLLCDKLGLEGSPLPEIFIGLIGDPIADIGCRLKVTDVLGRGARPISLGIPRTVLALLGFQRRARMRFHTRSVLEGELVLTSCRQTT
jgi:hypothetical protein